MIRRTKNPDKKQVQLKTLQREQVRVSGVDTRQRRRKRDRYDHIKPKVDIGKQKEPTLTKTPLKEFQISEELQRSPARGDDTDASSATPPKKIPKVPKLKLKILDDQVILTSGAAMAENHPSQAAPPEPVPFDSQYALPPSDTSLDTSGESRTGAQQKALLEQQQQTESLIKQQLQKGEIVLVPEKMQTDEQPFRAPRKTTKISRLLTTPPTTSTANRFSPLNTQPTITERDIKTKAAATVKKPKSPKKDRYCPPIVMKGVANDHAEFVKEISKTIKKGFYIKYAPRSMLLYIKDHTEYISYRDKLKGDVEFHTYSTPQDKTHAFVLRGLYHINEVGDITNDLVENYQLDVKSVFRMRTQYAPLFLIITNPEVTLRYLETNCK